MEIQQTWPLFAIACNTTQPAIRFGFGSPAFSVWVVGRQAGRQAGRQPEAGVREDIECVLYGK